MGNQFTGALRPDHAAWLEKTFTRNRSRFGGFFMEGGDRAPTPPAPAPAPPAPAPPAPTPTPPPPGDPADDGKGGKDAILADLAKERDKRQALEQQIADLQSTQQGQLDAIAKALGLKSDDTPPDPAKLAQQIAEEQNKVTAAENREKDALRKLVVVTAAATHEANAAALLDSTSFLSSIAEIDPGETDKIAAAVKAAVDANPALKAIPATPPFGGGPRGTTGNPDEVGAGLPRLRNAYAQSSK